MADLKISQLTETTSTSPLDMIIINKDDTLLTDRWAKVASSTFAHLGVNGILGLVG